ncbi:MAG: glucoamylase family protein [Saprospiraceae bacterium]
MHIELNWSNYQAVDRYEVWRKAESESEYSVINSTRQLRMQDWTGRTEPQSELYSYFIRALSVPGTVLATSDTINSFVFAMSDEQYLDMVQEYTFRYFWEYAHPVSGLARERLGSDDIVTTGGSGFGIMSLMVGVHRQYITRDQAVDRLLQIVSFLQFADRFHGVFPHWMNGETGEALPFSTFDNGGDLVETAFLMQGLLTAREYFNQDNEKENVLREIITSVWEDVEWDHYSRNNSGVLYWHWSPQFAWQMNFPIRGYNEALIVYLLAIASPTHAVPPSYWTSGWAGSGYVNGFSWYGHKLFVGPPLGGPLFFAHYSYIGFDPRNIKDQYTNYFEHNRNHTLVNMAWCVSNPLGFEGYGPDSWGLTASDDPFGYSTHAPGNNTDNGTLTPAAAIPSMPYTPDESIAVLRHFYQQYGAQLWGHYGFYDAFNPEENWFADSYLAIDQGPIINMIENYRSGILWNAFMSNPEITSALDAIGFEEDPVSVEENGNALPAWKVYPTISSGSVTIDFQDNHAYQDVNIQLMDVHGRIISSAKMIQINPERVVISNIEASGWIWISVTNDNLVIGSRAIWLE